METQKSTDVKPEPAAVVQPSWWTAQHSTSWDRVKEAFRRDWEQTKADLTSQKSGIDLDQGAGNTLKQAVGSEPIPAPDQQNLPDGPKEATMRLEKLSTTSAKAQARMARAGNEIIDARVKMIGEIQAAEHDLQEKRREVVDDE